jgi:hypothetical protein
MRIFENVLLIIIGILMVPVIPFLYLLSKVHEKIHRNDPWIY